MVTHADITLHDTTQPSTMQSANKDQSKPKLDMCGSFTFTWSLLKRWSLLLYVLYILTQYNFLLNLYSTI